MIICAPFESNHGSDIWHFFNTDIFCGTRFAVLWCLPCHHDRDGAKRVSFSTSCHVPLYFSFRWHVKDKYLYLGDGKVVGNWSGGCAACLGEIIPVGEAAASRSPEGHSLSPVTRGNRRGLLSLQASALVVDGFLSSESNYTGLVIMSGTDWFVDHQKPTVVFADAIWGANGFAGLANGVWCVTGVPPLLSLHFAKICACKVTPHFMYSIRYKSP